VIDDLLRRVKENQDQALEDRSVRDEVEERVVRHVRRVEPVRAVRTPRVMWFLPLVAAAVAVLATWAVMRRSPEPASIGYEVDGGARSVGGFVAALEPAEIRFSEGSRVSLRRGASARVLSTTASGAEVALERGVLEGAIVHDDDTDWTFFAGPFAIAITGTRFVASWDPSAASLSVAVSEGSVRVEGTCLDRPRAVRAGDRIDVACEGWTEELAASAREPAVNEATLEPSSVEPARVFVDPAVPDRVAVLPRERRALPEPAPAPDEPSPELSETTPSERPGSEPEVVPAEPAESAIERASRASLAGDTATAERLLRSVRDERGGSSDASLAAFLLGRLAFDEQRDYREAARWFATYVAEQPGGSLVREAMGRELEARIRTSDGARDAASRYLARFPNGPHAPRAREILGPR
jgi:transmembrane sensor